LLHPLLHKIAHSNPNKIDQLTDHSGGQDFYSGTILDSPQPRPIVIPPFTETIVCRT
jgi:hypothetical protein